MRIDSLITYGKITYGVGDTLRAGFFNKLFRNKDQVVRVRIDNPNISLIGLNNIYVKKPKKWYQTDAFKIGTGVVLGLSIGLIAR
jgi:hypothetical protein